MAVAFDCETTFASGHFHMTSIFTRLFLSILRGMPIITNSMATNEMSTIQ